MPLEILKKRREFLAVASARSKWAAPGLVLQAKRRKAALPDETAPPGDPPDADSLTGGSPASSGRAGHARKAPPPADAIRYGLTASKKVGNAVIRNRCRRRLRALAEELLPEAGKPGNDYVLIARAETAERDWQALREDLLHALRRTDAPRKNRNSGGNGAPRRGQKGQGPGDSRPPRKPRPPAKASGSGRTPETDRGSSGQP